MYPILMRLADRGLLETTWESSSPGWSPATSPIPADRARAGPGRQAGRGVAPQGPADRLAARTGASMKSPSSAPDFRRGRWPWSAAAALWLFGFQTSVGGPPTDPPPDLGYYLQMGVFWVFLVTPWLIAVNLLRGRRSSTAQVGPRRDLPARLVALAVLTLPEQPPLLGRRDDRRARGRPRPACPTAVCRRVHSSGSCAAGPPARLPRSPEVRPSVHRHRGTGRRPRLHRRDGLLLGALPDCCAPPLPRLRPAAGRHPGRIRLAERSARQECSSRIGLASGIAVGATLTIAAGLLLTSRLGLRGVAGLDVGVLPYLYLIPIAVVFAGSAWAARRRSFRAGVQTAVWTVLLASLLTFAVALPEAVRWYDLDTSLILASDAVPLNAVGEYLRNFTWSLLLLPFWWLPFGLIGVALFPVRKAIRCSPTAGATEPISRGGAGRR